MLSGATVAFALVGATCDCNHTPTRTQPQSQPPPQAWLPESPRWLLLSGAGRDAAAAALVRAEGRRAADPRVVEAELDGIAAASGGATGGLGQLLGEERFRRPLLIGSSLMLFQQVGCAVCASELAWCVSLGTSNFEFKGPRAQLAGVTGEQSIMTSLSLRPSSHPQITGQPSVLYYANQIFEKAGFSSGQVRSSARPCAFL